MRVDIFLNINNYMNTANDNVHDVLDMNNYRVEKLKKNKKEGFVKWMEWAGGPLAVLVFVRFITVDATEIAFLRQNKYKLPRVQIIMLAFGHFSFLKYCTGVPARDFIRVDARNLTRCTTPCSQDIYVLQQAKNPTTRKIAVRNLLQKRVIKLDSRVSLCLLQFVLQRYLQRLQCFINVSRFFRC